MSEMSRWPTGRLLSAAARSVERRWHEQLAAHGLTHAGLIALDLLGAGPLSQAELARRSRVTAQTMTRTVQRLERAGFVRRDPDPADRRRLLVERTDEGTVAWRRACLLERSMVDVGDDLPALRAALVRIIGGSGTPLRPAPPEPPSESQASAPPGDGETRRPVNPG